MLPNIKPKQQAQALLSNKQQCFWSHIAQYVAFFTVLNENKFKKTVGRSVISHLYEHTAIPFIFVSGSSVCIAALLFTLYIWCCRYGKTGTQPKLCLLWLWLQEQKLPNMKDTSLMPAAKSI